jgi:hypothetical protein
VLDAMQSSAFSETLLDRAVARNRALKSGLHGLRQGDAAPATLAYIGCATHQALVETIREQSANVAVERHLDGD